MPKSGKIFVSTIWVVGTLLLCPLTTKTTKKDFLRSDIPNSRKRPKTAQFSIVFKCNKYEQFLDVFSSWVYQILKILFLLSQLARDTRVEYPQPILGKQKFSHFLTYFAIFTRLEQARVVSKVYSVLEFFHLLYLQDLNQWGKY